MNEQHQNPQGTPSGLPPNIPSGPPLPPLIPTARRYSPGEQPLGEDAVERTPIAGVVAAIEAILRQPRRVMFQLKQAKPGGLIGSLLAIAILCSFVYGIVVGTFSGGEQYWAAPLKIALGLLISGLICLPSLYIFSCLGGSHARLAEVFGLVAGLLALMTILLIGFAPVAWVFSQSTKSVSVMGGLHLAFWIVAVAFGLRFLAAGFKQMEAKSNGALNTWVVIFLLVCLQMTTALRPILGKSDQFLPSSAEKKFFIGHWLDCIDQEAKDTSPNKTQR
jgi:hypothetical protein